MMGEISRTLVQLSGPNAVHGIIPAELVSVERKRNPLVQRESDRERCYGTLTVVKDMHARKSMMAEAADAFVALPVRILPISAFSLHAVVFDCSYRAVMGPWRKSWR